MITGRPRVLIVDDDAVSLSFFAAAVADFGAAPVCAADAAAAVAAARAAAPALLLIDRLLADADGPELLRMLRQDGHVAPAVATSAELGAAIIDGLRAAGFADTLLKPASVATVQSVIGPHLTQHGRPGLESAAGASTNMSRAMLLDDDSALAAIGGDRAALAALRQLFRGELEALLAQLAATAPDAEAMRRRLHRLRASCGFCGAAALGSGAARLAQAFDAGAGEAEFDRFARTLRLTLDALDAAREPRSLATP